jgi:ABC-2 type transport system permease protein
VSAVVARRAFRQLWLGATVWAVAFAVTVAASALTYVRSFPTAAGRAQLAATTSADAGLAVLLGPVSAVGTVGGYTVYKCYVFLTVIGALWALLVTTRLLRGEEDAGRWQLVVSGEPTPARATASTLVAVGAGTGLLFAGATLGALLAGRDPAVGFRVGPCLLYGASLAVAPLTFAAVGALTSQVARTRRQATGLGLGVFAAAVVVRMVADSGPATRWLLWFTPFGWTERMRPFTAGDVRPLVPAVVMVAVLVAMTVVVAARRDVGDGLLASRDVTPLRPFGLRSPLGLAVRLEWGVLSGWCLGAAATGFVFGMIAKVAIGAVPDSLRNALERFDVHGAFVDQYLAVAFLMVATVVALLPAGPLGALADEETSGRLVHVLSRGAGRTGLLAGRLGLAAVAVVTAGTLAGVAAWAGAAMQGVELDLGHVLLAGLNVVPTALVALAIGAVVLACAPRYAARAVYGVVIGSLLVDHLAPMIGSSVDWLSRLSLFHYQALAPAQSPDPLALSVNLAVAAVLGGLAMSLFARRDLRSA